MKLGKYGFGSRVGIYFWKQRKRLIYLPKYVSEGVAGISVKVTVTLVGKRQIFSQ